jgi:predicted transglutaminase-like cysteine proteinase
MRSLKTRLSSGFFFLTISVAIAAPANAASVNSFLPFKTFSSTKTQAQPFLRHWQPVLAPFGHVRFCLDHPDQCARKRVSIRKQGVAMTPDRLAQIARVNAEVNRAIRPTGALEGPTGDTWSLAPRAGDCDDYAVTKRARLLAMGFPSDALLLTQVTARGENHLVLMVRMKGATFILDNLASAPREVNLDRLAVLRLQSPHDPNLWMRPVDSAPLIASQQGRPRV